MAPNDTVDIANQQVVPNYNISESADKITLKTKLKRGTGTRDEDKFDAKVKGDNPDEVAERMADLMDALGEQGLVETARNTQAGGD